MGPSAAWFYERQLRLHRNWKLDGLDDRMHFKVSLKLGLWRCTQLFLTSDKLVLKQLENLQVEWRFDGNC